MTLDLDARAAAARRRVRLAAGAAAVVVLFGVSVVVSQGHGGAPGISDEQSEGDRVPGAGLDLPDASLPGAESDEELFGGAAPESLQGSSPQQGPPDGPVDAGEGFDLPPDATAPGDAYQDGPVLGFVPPARRATLPNGAEQVDEFPVKFPFTTEGAAAAAVAMTRYSATLDFATASEVMRLYSADASAADATAATAVESARARLGVPATGPAPDEAGLFAEPVGVAMQVVSADEVKVSIASVAEYRLGEEIDRELVSLNSFLKWDAGASDWKLVPTPADQLQGPTPAELGTPEFNDAGWSAIDEVQA